MNNPQLSDSESGEKASVAKLFEQGSVALVILYATFILDSFGSWTNFPFFSITSNLLIVGLHKILSLLEADDADVRIHAVKVVANLAAEGTLLYLF